MSGTNKDPAVRYCLMLLGCVSLIIHKLFMLRIFFFSVNINKGLFLKYIRGKHPNQVPGHDQGLDLAGKGSMPSIPGVSILK